MNAFVEQLARFGWGRLAAILGLTAGAAAALMMFTLTMNGSNQALLYSGLAPADAAAVSERLDQAGISYELRNGGSTVYVASADVDQARLRVNEDGALGFGSVGNEIFDESELGTTSFVQNINARRALEGELARTINTLTNVSAARVHIVLPERRLFSRDAQEPSASVVISVNGQMPSGAVATIRNLVATAVPGLSPNRITLAEDTGRMLASPSDEDGNTSIVLEDRRADVETRLRARILDMVEGVVGPGAARVAVTAELDRESRTSTSLEYDPNLQVEVSRRSETQNSEEPINDGAVSVSENQPDAAGTTNGAQLATNSSEITERNFENSSTQTTTVREAGEVSRLSVSVVVDQIATTNEDGSVTFTERPQEQMQAIERMVAAAAGFPLIAADRNGTQILDVSQMAFSRPNLTLGTPAPTGFSIDQLDFMRIAEIAVLFITAVLIIFLVARPLIKGAISGGGAATAGAGGNPALVGAGVSAGAASLAGPEATLLPEDGPVPMIEGAGMEGEDNIDIAQIDGQVKKSSLRKVADLVDNHPDETVSILRTWMHEGTS